MTRTDVMASSRPQTEGAVSMRSSSLGVPRRLSAISAMLLLALALVLPATALAAESTTGYNQTPTTPTTTTTPTPTTGTSPSKEEKSPASEPAPEKTSTTPTTTTTKASTLPFTGFDLRWSLAVGVLLMGAGFSIVAVQRRQRR
jgi:hypothetical protein